MTEDALRQLLAIYGPGLDAEVRLLLQLRHLALAQHKASTSGALTSLVGIAQEREQTMAALVKIEHELGPARSALSTHREVVSHLEEFQQVSRLQRVAAELVATIVHCDQDTLQALQDAELARRFAAQALEAGGETVAAYRRAMTPPVSGAGLVDRIG